MSTPGITLKDLLNGGGNSLPVEDIEEMGFIF